MDLTFNFQTLSSATRWVVRNAPLQKICGTRLEIFYVRNGNMVNVHRRGEILPAVSGVIEMILFPLSLAWAIYSSETSHRAMLFVPKTYQMEGNRAVSPSM